MNLREVFTWVEEGNDLVCRGWMWGLPECHFAIDEDDIGGDTPHMMVVIDGYIIEDLYDFWFPYDAEFAWNKLALVAMRARAEAADAYMLRNQEKDLIEFNRYKDIVDKIFGIMSNL